MYNQLRDQAYNLARDFIEDVLRLRGSGYELIDPQTESEDTDWYSLPRVFICRERHGSTLWSEAYIYCIKKEGALNDKLIFEVFSPEDDIDTTIDSVDTDTMCDIANRVLELEANEETHENN